jgi:hypothetical protein
MWNNFEQTPERPSVLILFCTFKPCMTFFLLALFTERMARPGVGSLFCRGLGSKLFVLVGYMSSTECLLPVKQEMVTDRCEHASLAQ